MKPLRVLVLCHPQLLPPATLEGYSEKEINVWKTEYDVITTLQESGHEVRAIGVQFELQPIRDAIVNWKPDIVFNLLDEFHGETLFCQNVAAFLELMRIPYTGCNSRGMVLAQGKDLSKKLLKYHRVPVPDFAVFPIGRKVKRPPKLDFPLIVKSLTEDASLGISQASVVDSDEKLEERVRFIHERIGTAAIAEQYIHGREIYVGVIGNADRYTVFPVWEVEFSKLAPGQLPIATERAKHDPVYQDKRGVLQGPADDLPQSLVTRIRSIVRRVCQTLELDGYARIDFRLAEDGTPYFIEANPNPEIASNEEFAQAALHDGVEYGELLDRILMLGIRRAGAEAEAA
ncbi:MAG: ATP-grasp domain-containing protein [Hyphomonadaceae bacterium]|nr:ATP-grasp domain-containing protein [Hyphomonadaceae bacterium]